MNFISNYANFAYFLLIDGYGKYALQKELVAAPFAGWFKTATLRKPE